MLFFNYTVLGLLSTYVAILHLSQRDLPCFTADTSTQH